MGPSVFKFRLYVAPDTQNSTEALANLTALCGRHLKGRHEIEVINVLLEPQRAVVAGIRMIARVGADQFAVIAPRVIVRERLVQALEKQVSIFICRMPRNDSLLAWRSRYFRRTGRVRRFCSSTPKRR
jgi:hypothetical protein